jgi:hypothetical protein
LKKDVVPACQREQRGGTAEELLGLKSLPHTNTDMMLEGTRSFGRETMDLGPWITCHLRENAVHNTVCQGMITVPQKVFLADVKIMV